MRLIENRRATITINGNKKEVTVLNLLLDCIEYLPDSGLTAAEIEERLRLSDIVYKAKERGLHELSFNETDYKAAADCVRQMKWKIFHPFVLEFDKLFK